MTRPDLEEVRARLARTGGSWTPHDVATVLRDLGWAVSDAMVLATVEALHRASTGWGPLDELGHLEIRFHPGAARTRACEPDCLDVGFLVPGAARTRSFFPRPANLQVPWSTCDSPVELSEGRCDDRHHPDQHESGQEAGDQR